MIGRAAKVVPIECVVRGHIAGSGWREYKKSGTVCGIPLPDGLQLSDRLPEPLFTPSTKADEGHDENISFETACDLVGKELMTKLRDLSLEIYTKAAAYAAERGIILADTKFEFGHALDLKESTDELIIIDEVLTQTLRDSGRLMTRARSEQARPTNRLFEIGFNQKSTKDGGTRLPPGQSRPTK